MQHRVQLLCLTVGLHFFTWSNFEVVRMSRKDKEFEKLNYLSELIEHAIRLDIGCYPGAPVSIFLYFASPEGLSLPPIMTLLFFGVHIYQLRVRTLEHAQPQTYAMSWHIFSD